MQTLKELQLKFGTKLDPIFLDIEVVDLAGATHQIKIHELSQPDAVDFVQRAYGTKIFEEDADGKVIYEGASPQYLSNGETLKDSSGKEVLGGGRPKPRGFAVVAKESRDIMFEFLAKSVKDDSKDKKFFEKLKLSSRMFSVLAEVFFDINCIEDLVQTQGNLTALPFQRTVAAQN